MFQRREKDQTAIRGRNGTREKSSERRRFAFRDFHARPRQARGRVSPSSLDSLDPFSGLLIAAAFSAVPWNRLRRISPRSGQFQIRPHGRGGHVRQHQHTCLSAGNPPPLRAWKLGPQWVRQSEPRHLYPSGWQLPDRGWQRRQRQRHRCRQQQRRERGPRLLGPGRKGNQGLGYLRQCPGRLSDRYGTRELRDRGRQRRPHLGRQLRKRIRGRAAGRRRLGARDHLTRVIVGSPCKLGIDQSNNDLWASGYSNAAVAKFPAARGYSSFTRLPGLDEGNNRFAINATRHVLYAGSPNANVFTYGTVTGELIESFTTPGATSKVSPSRSRATRFSLRAPTA